MTQGTRVALILAAGLILATIGGVWTWRYTSPFQTCMRDTDANEIYCTRHYIRQVR